MAKIIGVIFNGDEQILCNGELSTVIEEQLMEEPKEEENKPEEEPKEDENKPEEEPKEDEKKPKEKK